MGTIDHCFDKEDGESAIKKIIRDTLYEELPESVFGNYEAYRVKINDYIYTRYKNVA
jgi:hypothetical protein